MAVNGFRKALRFAKMHAMKTHYLLAACAALCAVSFAAFPTAAQPAKTEHPAPGEIVGAAKAQEWVAIAPSDLLVMDLAADSKGKPRRVVIQLMPAPFSQGWIGNIRKLAAAKFVGRHEHQPRAGQLCRAMG